jgi:hypothetical protein
MVRVDVGEGHLAVVHDGKPHPTGVAHVVIEGDRSVRGFGSVEVEPSSTPVSVYWAAETFPLASGEMNDTWMPPPL